MSIHSKSNKNSLNEAYKFLWKEVIRSYNNFFEGLISISESRKNFTFDPYLSSLKQSLPKISGAYDSLKPYVEKDTSLLHDVVDFVTDGIYEKLQLSKEYKDIVNLMDTNSNIKSQLDKYHRVSGLMQTMRHWTYISHVLKTLLFHYIIHHQLGDEFLSKVVSEQEEFFQSDHLEYAVICPMIHFKLDKKVPVPIQLSENICIRPFTDQEKMRLSRNFIGVTLAHILSIML